MKGSAGIANRKCNISQNPSVAVFSLSVTTSNLEMFHPRWDPQVRFVDLGSQDLARKMELKVEVVLKNMQSGPVVEEWIVILSPLLLILNRTRTYNSFSILTNLLKFVFISPPRWGKWWSEQGTATCWPSCCIQKQVTWLNPHMLHTASRATSGTSWDIKHVGSPPDPWLWTETKGQAEDWFRATDSVSCCVCRQPSVGRRDGATLSGSGGCLEESPALSEGTSERGHETYSDFVFPPLTTAAFEDPKWHY